MGPGATAFTTLTTPGWTLTRRTMRSWPPVERTTTSTQVQVHISNCITILIVVWGLDLRPTNPTYVWYGHQSWIYVYVYVFKSLCGRYGNGACERSNCSWGWNSNSRRGRGQGEMSMENFLIMLMIMIMISWGLLVGSTITWDSVGILAKRDNAWFPSTFHHQVFFHGDDGDCSDSDLTII